MRYRDLLESKLSNDFQFSDWGYWIEPDGRFTPVTRHGHHLLYRIDWEAFASGRIRVTAVSEALKGRTQTGARVLGADFFAKFVTKAALRSLMTLINEFEFDVYHICGLTYRTKSDMNWSTDMSMEEFDARRIDARTCQDLSTKQQARAAIRGFMATALAAAPPQLDASPERW